MASMTTVRCGASTDPPVTGGSCLELEGEFFGKGDQYPARVGMLAPELEEVILGHPVPVADVEPPRALDERDRAGDVLLGRRRGDRRDGREHRAVHQEAHR